MIHQIVNEINIALENKCFISALSNALIIKSQQRKSVLNR